MINGNSKRNYLSKERRKKSHMQILEIKEKQKINHFDSIYSC